MNWNQTRFGRLCILKQNAAFDDALRRNRGRRWSGDGCEDEAQRLPDRQGREAQEGHQEVERIEADRSTEVEESQREA